MACERLHMGTDVAMVCGVKARKLLDSCAYCGRGATRQCDGPKSEGKTCDRFICDRCTWSPEPDKDFCPSCAPLEQDRRRQLSIFGGDVP